MKLIFDKDVLCNALEISNSLTSGQNFDIYKFTLVRVKDGKCTFSSTDTTDIIYLNVALKSGEDCEFLLNCKLTMSLLKTLQKGEVLLEIDENHATLKSGKFKANIPTASIVEYPPIPEIGNVDKGLKFKYTDLQNALSFVAPFTSSDRSREIFCGINYNYKFRTNNETNEKEALVTLCASDGHRLAKTDLVANDLEEVPPVEGGVIITTKAINIISKYFSKETEVLVSVKDKRKIICKGENITLVTSLISGSFPDFSSVIPTETKKIIVNKQDLISCLKRCSLINFKTYVTTFSFYENNINVITIGNENGTSLSEDIECNYSDEKLVIGLNAKYLEQSLSMVDDSFAVLCIVDKDSPVKIISASEYEANDEGALSLIMPLQI